MLACGGLSGGNNRVGSVAASRQPPHDIAGVIPPKNKSGVLSRMGHVC